MGHEVASRGGEASSFPLSMEEVQSVHAAMLSELRHRSDVLRVFAFPYGLAGSICSYCLFSLSFMSKATIFPSPGISPQAPAQVLGHWEGTHTAVEGCRAGEKSQTTCTQRNWEFCIDLLEKQVVTMGWSSEDPCASQLLVLLCLHTDPTLRGQLSISVSLQLLALWFQGKSEIMHHHQRAK